MTFRNLVLATGLLLGLAAGAPSQAEARSSFAITISPYGSSIYIGPRHYYPRSYYGYSYNPYYYNPYAYRHRYWYPRHRRWHHRHRHWHRY